jgi:hypothetical protein
VSGIVNGFRWSRGNHEACLIDQYDGSRHPELASLLKPILSCDESDMQHDRVSGWSDKRTIVQLFRLMKAGILDFQFMPAAPFFLQLETIMGNRSLNVVCDSKLVESSHVCQRWK